MIEKDKEMETETETSLASSHSTSAPITSSSTVPEVTPNHPSGVYIIWSDKYNPERGHSPLNLTSSNFDTAMEQFVAGELSFEATAYAIIDALFERDFSGEDGKHWDSPDKNAKLITRHESGAMSYQVEKYSDWDWKDINARARSQALITMSGDRKRIRLDNYSFYCSG